MDQPVIGIVGLGTMGLGIAQVFAAAGHRVLATDAQAGARESAAARLGAALQAQVARGRLAPDAAAQTLQRLEVVEEVAGLAPARLVIEAVAEDEAVKAALFRGLEGVLAGDAVLATNTSSLPVARLGQGLAHPSRLIGLHFFNPAPVMKLVELIAPAGAEAAARFAGALAAAAGKVVIAAPDTPGFIVNRCARPFYGEALCLLEEGRGAAEIDAAMVAAGYRMGPFALIDLVGADINLAATEGLRAAMGGHPRYHVFDALRAQVARGDLGRKTGRGFVVPDGAAEAPADAAAIALRIEAVLANEAATLLDEGGAGMADIDAAVKLGLNFPRGPFDAARGHGPDRVRATLAGLAAAAPAHLRGRYDIARGLAAL